MNIALQRLLVPFILLFVFAGKPSAAIGQVKDTVIYDYSGGGCTICGGDYNCFTSSQQLLIGNGSGLRVSEIKIKVFHTACSSDDFYAVLNGDTLGSFSQTYSCSCNDCFTDSLVADFTKLGTYQSNDTNQLWFGGMYTCANRIMVIRTYTISASNDAGIMSIDSPSRSCPGSQKIKVTIRNYGNNQIDSLKVNWTYNGINQTPYSFIGLLDTTGGSGSTKASITLGYKTLIAGKTDTIKIWTTMPNGVSDTVNTNDTIQGFIRPKFGDTLTVGGSNPDFSTIQGAINALQTSGLCKSVVVNIRPGTYNEQLSIGKIPGSDTLSTVTFRSSTGDSSDVVIYYSSSSSANNYTVLLNNSENILFKQLTLQATNTSYGRVVEIRGTFLRLGFQNCLIMGVSTTSTSSNHALISHGTISNGANSQILIDRSEIKNGSIGFYWSNSTSAQNLKITNTKFTGQYYINIYAHYIKNAVFHNNEITRTSSGYSSGYGIYFYNNQHIKVTNNKILQPCGGYGIYSEYVSGSSSLRSLIANNFISVGSQTNVSAYAWYSYSLSYIDFYNNSTYTNTNYSGYYNLYISYGNNIRLMNNSIFQANQGYLMYNYYSGAKNLERSNFNNFYSTKTTGPYFYSNSSYNTLSDLQNGSKLDSNSTWSNPNYKSTSNLHLYSSELNGKALPDSRITSDIDGEARNTSKPDIGADEFDLVKVDAGISGILAFKADSVCIEARLRNNGQDTLKTAEIRWSINGTSQTTYNWTGSILSGENATVCIGKYRFIDSVKYTVKVWSRQPNNQADTINYNDTFIKVGKPALSGVYTIGGTSPNFTTFNAAVSAMIANGISDTVLFKVRNGTYNERVEIPLITGASKLNAIVFESENKDKSLVTLSYSTNSNYEVLSLNGARWVSFRHLTIKSTFSSPSRAVTLSNSASNIIFSNNKLESSTLNSTDLSYNSVVYNNNAGSNLQFINNHFLNGSVAIYAHQNSGTLLKGNIMENQYYMNVYLDNNTNFNISGNTLKSTSTYSGFYNLYVATLYGSNTISDNKITGPNKSENTSLYISQLTPSSTSDSNYIYNNFISTGGSNSSKAIYIYSCSNTYFTHNNIHYYGTYASTNYAAMFDYINNSYFYNNNFTNTAGGYAFYLYNATTGVNNFNNYYTAGSYLTQIKSYNYSSLAGMQANYIDSNSVSFNPDFVSNSDLHMRNVKLNATAKKMHFPKKDIDQEARDSATPDIGADEFVPVGRDAGVRGFYNPKDIIKADTIQIKVIVGNFGLNTIYSYKVNCKINKDTFPVISISDSLISGDTAHVIVGNYIFKRDSINNLMAWSSEPNGSNDQKTINDTFRIVNKKTAMSGVYTIGGSSPDFTTFNKALNALKDLGVSDSVTFRVRSGTYTEQLLITPIAGAGNYNSIIFESANMDSTSVTLQYNSVYSDSNYVVYFNGASGITFRKMSIKSMGTSYSVVFKYENKAQYNILSNNYIKGYTVNSTSSRYSVILSSNSNFTDNYNTFYNNQIEGGSYGMYWYGYGSPAYQESGLIIRNNLFLNQYYAGAYLYYQESALIESNTFVSNSTYSSYYGIYGYYMKSRSKITANQINRSNNAGYGIYLYGCTAYSDTLLVANNMINIGGTNSPYGINLYDCYYVHTVNNTIRIGPATSSSGAGVYHYYGGNNEFHNNIVENAGAGYAVNNQSAYFTQSDHNNLRTKGTNLIQWNYTNYTSLASYQAASQQDSNSLTEDPLFISATNLHSRQVGLNGKALVHPWVKTDIDNQQRDTLTPDIGADEFNLPDIDVSVVEFLSPKGNFKADTTMIKVVVRNMGLNTLTSFKLNCKINRDTFPQLTINDTLSAGDTVHVIIGNYVFKRDSINNLTSWTTNPNNSADQNTFNDTSRIINKITAMSGVYTIGGSSPDFPSFKAAIKAMNIAGIVDGVRFRVRAGTYNEQLRIIPINGAGALNSVIFESANLDSTSVTLQYNSIYSDSNYVVYFNGASGITFRNMTIKSLGTTYSVVFLYENKAQYNILSNNYIKGLVSAVTGSRNSVIASFNSTFADEFNEFNNNLIEGGSFGMYWYGYGAPNNNENGTKIKNNNFRNQYYMGMYVYYQKNPEIEKNTITSSSTYSNFYGIYGIYLYNKARITSNNISPTSTSGYASGIYLQDANGNGDTILIANNMINLAGSSNPYGIYCSYNYYSHIVNNTVRLGTSTNTSAIGIIVYYGNYNQLINNIVENSGTGYAIQIASSSSVSKSDYNNFRTAGSTLAYWNGSNYSTLAALQSVTQRDSHSLSLDPLFLNSNNLHTRQIGFNGKASPYPKVKTDIDGDIRNSATPDIGADEFNPPALDISMVEFLNPSSAIKPDTTDIRVAVRNIGSRKLTAYKIHCKINRDTLATIRITKPLASGDTAHITIGNYIFMRDSVNNISVWTTDPNDSSDENTINDTIRIINKKTAMSGIYTIGGSSPDFNSFKAAIKAMNSVGIIGQVRFKVRSGTYTEQLRLQAVSGAGAANSIIFESESLDSTLVTLQYNANLNDTNYIVYFDGASGITFRKMTIRALSSSLPMVFRFENKSQNNVLSNNVITGNGTGSTNAYDAVIGSYNSSYSDDNNTFSNNIIEGGSYGIYWQGYGSPNNTETNTQIRNNQFKNQYYMGIFMQYQTNAVIDRNRFSSSSTYYVNYTVYGNNLKNKSRITSNVLNMDNSSGYGIYLDGCNGNSDTLLIANNMITKGGSNNTYGVQLSSSSYVHIVNNTLKLSSVTNNTSAGIYISGGSNNQLLNNISENLGAGYCMNVTSTGSVSKSNRNNFRASGSNIASWNGTAYSNLNTLKAASQKDSQSLSLDPMFLSSDNLHIRQLGLNGKASYHPLVKTDIDGQARNSSSPDIGADEFNPPVLDAGIFDILLPKTPFPRDSQYVAVVLKNSGLNSITSVKIDWRFNNVAQSTLNWTGNLASNDTIHVRLSKKYFNKDSVYSAKVWTSLPNSYNDTINYNDTSKVTNQYPALSGIYTIGGSSPDFPTFTDAIDAMTRGGIIGNVTFNVRNGSYSEKLTIPKIVGADKRNSIIFQSENLDSTKVTLINSYNTPGYNYTLWLQGAVGVTFRHMTIAATNTSYGIVVYMNNGASLNTFTNDVLEGVSTTSTGDNMALVWSGISNSSNNVNNHFTKNVFKKGSYGLYSNGNNGTHDRNLLIHNNIFDLPYYTGIYLAYNDSVSITENRISVGASANAFGIRMEYCNGSFRINKNIVTVSNGYMGLYLYSCTGISTKYALVSTNLISVLGNGNYYGIYCSGSYINFYNNNIHVNSNNTSSYAAMLSGSNIRSVNNIFDHSGVGYALYSSALAESNYNNYRSNGSNLAYWGGDRTNLSALRSANSMDAKSISADPVYVSETDLHVRAIDLDKAGKALSETRFDIDGNKRDSLLPDIGADEFIIPSPNDAGISAYVGPVSAFSPGSNPVKVVLNNYGSDTLKSAIIQWTINGTAQSSYAWTGAIKTGASATISIGSFNFSTGVNYSLVAWPISPNGITDTIAYNDTLKRKNIYCGLAGTYTIGGYLPDFKTFAEANFALNQRGVVDTVTFKVRNGTYNERIEILPFPGSMPSRPVTFTSESGDSTKVLLQFSIPGNDYYLFHLKGADNITISRMTLRGYGNPLYNNVVVIDNVSSNITVSNNRIISEPSYYSYYGYYGSGVLSGTDKDDSTKVLNNFISGDMGIQLIGGGTGSNQQEKGMVIEGNKIDGFEGIGIRLNYINAPVIRKNNIVANGYHPYYWHENNLIYLDNIFNEMNISYNKLTGDNNSGIGMYVNGHQGTSSKKGQIYNNFISMPNPNNSGLSINNTTYCNISYNSINLFDTATNSSSSALALSLSTNMEVKNNVLCNDASTYAIRCDNVPTICNYNDLYSRGTNIGQVGSTNYANLSAWKSGTSRDANSKSVFPTFFSNTDLHTTLVNLDSAATPISGLTDDIDFNTRHTVWPDIGADEFNSLPNNLAVTVIQNPVSGCLIDSQQLSVTIFNYGSYPQKNFPVRYRVNNGTIVTQTFTDSILPGTSKSFSFNGKVNTRPTDNYFFKVWTDLSTEQYQLNDTVNSLIINYNLPDSVKIMSPADSIKNLSFPISLSWAPSAGATRYDIYIWPDTAQRPGSPAYYGLTQISKQILSGLTYGATYNWQILAKNPFCSSFGKVQRFTVRELPDLTVSAVSAPSTSFSGTNISVSWTIKNAGKGTTGKSNWYDLIYLSNDKVLDGLDPVLTGVINATSLTPSQSYNNSVNVTLPNGIIGKYYIIVKTEAYDYFLESNEGNNISDDTSGTSVSLTPPPDLQVISVIKPGTAFSGQTINMQFTVKNKGTGITRTSNSWTDNVFLNKDSAVGGTFMRSISRTGALDVDSTYKINTTITLPFNISGGHYIIVNTDVTNTVFEHATENNNHRISDSMKIIQTPPPDLIVRNVRIKDTSSNKEVVNLTYDLINQGGSGTTKPWTDVVFISRFSTFNAGTATVLTSFPRSYVDADDTLAASHNITIPDNLNGLFYLYIAADYYNSQYEGTKDTNNMSVKRAFRIHTPDLVVSSVSVPAADTSGKYILVDWVVKNKGQGKNIGGNREDKIFISSHSPYNKDSVILIDSVLYTATINPGDSILKSHYARIPNGTFGKRFVYVYTDFHNQIYENLLDTNNYRRSNTINVTLAPYPDLRAVAVTVPDSAEAGKFISVSYKVDNKGNYKARPTWSDKVYISKDSVYNPNKVVLLQMNTGRDTLQIDSSYEFNQIMLLPNHISAGNYYYYIYTDANNSLYEFLYETNNIKRSPKVYVKGYPPIDLTVTSSTIPDSIFSGAIGNFGYKVKNIGEAKTYAGLWSDNVALSLDTLLDPTDFYIGETLIATTLEKDSSYQRNIPYTVPNGLSGNYYVFFRTDWRRDNVDVDTLNNIKIARDPFGKPKKMKIKLSLSSDLEVSAWDVPSVVIAGQPATFSWKVSNKGDTTTKSGNWTDGVYLSTDYIIDKGDILLGTTSHKNNIKKGTFYNESGTFFIPSNISGSYVIIIKADNANREYEYQAENNNTGASGMTINIAPPGDLIVTSINAPSSSSAGAKVTVSYDLKNIGANPINGVRTDNIYLSSDTLLDPTDVLFASKTENASMIPNGTRNLSATADIKGIKTGNYYFLVFTDVKNNISESKDTNNISYGDIIDVNIPELPMKTLTKDSLLKNKELYYRLIIPDSLDGESILITLKGDSLTGNNELYVKFDNVPTRSDFEYGFSIPYYGNQEVMIPVAKKGTYYLMAYGSIPSGKKQPITLYARKLNFEIRRVNPVKGGNTGQVTVKIEGAKFDQNTSFNLVDPKSKFIIKSSQRPDSNLYYYNEGNNQARSISIINPTLAFATFDLKNQSIGIYDVEASKEDGNIKTSLLKGFQIELGSPPDIEIATNGPATTRSGVLSTFDVMFANLGNTDMVNGYLQVISNAGAPISFTIDGISKRETSLLIPLEEYNGVKGLLRPGGVGTITVYAFSSASMAFNVILVK